MKTISAERVVIAQSLQSNPAAYERALALASQIETSHLEHSSDAAISELESQMPWKNLPKRGCFEGPYDFSLVILGSMDWSSENSLFPGYHWAETRSARYEWENNNVLCHSATEIQTILGCSFDCKYCPYTQFLKIACNVELFVEKLDDFLNSSKRQLLYKLNNRSDTLCFEPEYGLTKLLVERFSKTKRHQLMLYSKSNNVEHLLDLDHAGRTVTCFTLSSPQTARLLEPSAPTFEERLQAAALCQRAGYPVRFRFSPLLPFRGWQADLRAMVETMSEQVQPELITLWTLSMTSIADLRDMIDLHSLDPLFLRAAQMSQTAMKGAKGAPFPDPFRTQLYDVITKAIAEYCPNTRVSLCLESPEVLSQLHSRLAIVDRAQICNCGPLCTSETIARAPAVADSVQRTQLALPKSRKGDSQANRPPKRLRKQHQ